MKGFISILGAISTMISAGTGDSIDKYQDTRPNVVFILVDDLGWNEVGFMGSDFYETPHLDSLSKRSFVFMEGYSNSAVCSPSRASIMTGQFTARTGITDWIGAAEGEKWRKHGRFDKLLPASYNHSLDTLDVVLPEVLKQHGYNTFFVGKWHLGGEESTPLHHGFDVNIGGYHGGSPQGGYYSPYNNPALPDGPDGENLTLRLARETAECIESSKNTPFFAFLSFYAVHGPIQTTKSKWAKFQQKAFERDGVSRGFEMGEVLPYRLHQDNPVYAGLVETMDDAVGIVLKSLEEQALLENTIIIFTSDNGGVVSGDSYSTNLHPLKGGKGNQWEGGVRVPLLIHLPQLDSAVRISTPVIGSDLYPTILDLVGVPLRPESHVDGTSLLPLLNGNQLLDRSLIWHYPHYGNQGGSPSSIIRRGKWKLIHYYEDNRNELYDLQADISESKDLIEQYPDTAKLLVKELTEYLGSVEAKKPTVDKAYDEKSRQQWLNRQKEQQCSKLEEDRRRMLSADYLPNIDWWGSKKEKNEINYE